MRELSSMFKKDMHMFKIYKTNIQHMSKLRQCKTSYNLLIKYLHNSTHFYTI